MKVELGGKRYRIGFRHQTQPVPQGFGMTFSKQLLDRHTLCTLRDENGEIVNVGRAFLNPQDNFCKATGRRLALKRAIEYFSYEDRKDIWEQYFREHTDLKRSESLRLTQETLDVLLSLTNDVATTPL